MHCIIFNSDGEFGNYFTDQLITKYQYKKLQKWILLRLEFKRYDLSLNGQLRLPSQSSALPG